MNRRESEFLAVKEAEGKTLIAQPATFILPHPYLTYRPDFYCVEENCFYEVAGTRQAYSQGKDKYAAFKAQYPRVKFKIVKPDASIYQTKPRPDFKLQGVPSGFAHLKTRERKLIELRGKSSIVSRLLIDACMTQADGNIRRFVAMRDAKYHDIYSILRGVKVEKVDAIKTMAKILNMKTCRLCEMIQKEIEEKA